MTYEVRHNGQPVVVTGWQPMAEAAWHRATRDQAQGGTVELLKDGVEIARHRIVGGRGAAWPEGPGCGLRELVRAIVQLLRHDDWTARELAEAMTAYGLPTARARVDGLRGTGGRSIELSHAEIVVMIYAVLNRYLESDPRSY